MTKSGRLYTGRSAAERDADRRQRLLEAAHELFGTDGYAATSIDRLCTAANVSTRHYYLLFTNKEDCFLALYDHITAPCLGRAVEVLNRTTGRPMRDRVPAAFLAYLQPILADRKATRIAFVESIVVGASSEEHRLAFREALIATVEQEGAAAVARGEIGERNFRLAALALIGAAGTVAYDWGRNPRAYTESEVEQALADIAVKLLVD